MSPDAANVLVAVWLFAVGGAIGSFLNVVVYRLPRGMSLVVPGSHCPGCGHPIRWFDNVPVLGWLALRGRCRDCRVRISPRYPIVELMTALLFLAIAAMECVGEGTNLPPQVTVVRDAVILGPRTPGELYGLCLYHLLLLCTLWAAVLLEYDGSAVPRRLYLPALVIGLAAPLAWPHLHPVAAWPMTSGWAAGLVDGLAGAAAGAIVGVVLAQAWGEQYRCSLMYGAACAGLFLGWQAVLAMGLIVTPVSVFALVRRRLAAPWRRLTPSLCLLLASLALIALWARLVAWWPWGRNLG